MWVLNSLKCSETGLLPESQMLMPHTQREKGKVVGEADNRSSSATKALEGSCASALRRLTGKYYGLD